MSEAITKLTEIQQQNKERLQNLSEKLNKSSLEGSEKLQALDSKFTTFQTNVWEERLFQRVREVHANIQSKFLT